MHRQGDAGAWRRHPGQDKPRRHARCAEAERADLRNDATQSQGEGENVGGSLNANR